MDAARLWQGVYKRNDGLLAAASGDELLMMSVERGRYFNLNEVGARIWELLATPTSVQSLVQSLVAEYEVAPAVASQEVQAFLLALQQRGLVSVADEPLA
ncbi:PqqD family peptide modification chaperone [Pseudomonas silvicola]|nr:PqqD family peptide modification chaperone [Pseudomonas silvicola]